MKFYTKREKRTPKEERKLYEEKKNYDILDLLKNVILEATWQIKQIFKTLK